LKPSALFTTLTAALLLAISAAPAHALVRSGRFSANPKSLGIAFTDVRFPSSRDSVELHGWWFPGADSSPVVVVVPGERGNMADKLQSVREWVRRGYSVLTFDLRDNGPGSPDDADSLAQVVFSSRWVNDTEGALWFARSRAGNRGVAVWGQDLGGVLAFVAAARARNNADAVATEGLFRTSQEQLYWLGTSQDDALVRRHRMLVLGPDEPASIAGGLRAPLFVVIAGKDEITPPDGTRKLLNSVHGFTDTWMVPDGKHAHLETTPGYFDHVADAFKRAMSRRRPPGAR
jgi:alpha-beta hydrolase superfamily lysophospholipase